MVAMAGTHQIWSLNLTTDRCQVYSGSGREGNANSRPENSTWAQPSGITAGAKSFYVADSESSAIRAINYDTLLANNVVGANADHRDLFAYGDKEGSGHDAKLQHPLGVHYCEANQTLYVADTYNHKIKVLSSEDKESSLNNWIGNNSSAIKPTVKDGLTS